MLEKLIFLVIVVFYPKALFQWIVAIIIAFVAAYFTVEVNGIAPMGIFLIWFMADYILIQIIFGILFNRKDHK
jgi:hypothetical protein